jgi:hypothetical protein
MLDNKNNLGHRGRTFGLKKNFYGQFPSKICKNSKTETYLVESPNLQYTQVCRVSYFNPIGIVLTAFLKILLK